MAAAEQKDYKALYEKEVLKRKRTWVKQVLYAQKARQAGITVSEAEIDAYIKKGLK